MTLLFDIWVIFLLVLLLHLVVRICKLFLVVHHCIVMLYYQNFLSIFLRFFLVFYNVLVYFVFLLHLHRFRFLVCSLHLLSLFYNIFLLLFLNVVCLLICIAHQCFCLVLIVHHIHLFQIVLLAFVLILFFCLRILILLVCCLLDSLMLHHLCCLIFQR